MHTCVITIQIVRCSVLQCVVVRCSVLQCVLQCELQCACISLHNLVRAHSTAWIHMCGDAVPNEPLGFLK